MMLFANVEVHRSTTAAEQFTIVLFQTAALVPVTEMPVLMLRMRLHVTLIVPLAADTPPPPLSRRMERSTVTMFAPEGEEMQAPPTEEISPPVKTIVLAPSTLTPAPAHPDMVQPVNVTLLLRVRNAHDPDPELNVQFTNRMNFALLA
jgi:hypothetical protein